jgi:hypothetical protein
VVIVVLAGAISAGVGVEGVPFVEADVLVSGAFCFGSFRFTTTSSGADSAASTSELVTTGARDAVAAGRFGVMLSRLEKNDRRFLAGTASPGGGAIVARCTGYDMLCITLMMGAVQSQGQSAMYGTVAVGRRKVTV